MVETQSNLWNFKNEIVRRTRFADDTVLIAESKEDLKEMMNELHQKCVENSMSLNAKKTKVMVIDEKEQIKMHPNFNMPIMERKIIGRKVESKKTGWN